MLKGENSHRTLRSKRIRWLLVCVICSPLVAHYYFNHVSREHELHNAAKRVNGFGQMYADQVSRALVAIELLTRELGRELSANKTWSQWSESKGHDFLRAAKSDALPQLRDLIIFDATGAQRFHSSLLPALTINISDRPYFQTLRDGGRRSLWGPYKGRNSGLMTYAIAHRIEHAGQFSGVAFAALELAHFQASCWNGKFDEDMMAFIVNRDGIIVAECRPPGELLSGNSAVGSALTAKLPAALSIKNWHIEQDEIYQAGHVIATRRIDHFPELSIVVALPESAALATWHVDHLRSELLLVISALMMFAGLRFIFTQIDQQALIEVKLEEDVAIRRSTEEALRASEERQRHLIETTSDWVWEVDRNGIYVYASAKVHDLLGYTPEEVIGKSPFDLMLPEEAARIAPQFREIAAAGLPIRRLENINRRKDGKTIVLETSGVPLFDSDGNLLGYRGMDRDITDRKQAEKAQRDRQVWLEQEVAARTQALSAAKDAAEAANRAKSTFLTNMSHELRTPLHGIMGMTELALHRTEEPKQKDFLGKALKSSHHLLHVINDILDISKIEAERLVLENVNFKLADILDNIVGMIGQTTKDKGLKLLLEPEPGLLDRRVSGDPLRLGQVLINLAGNAIKFTEHGSITIRAMLIEENPENVLLRWEVTDTGIGIDKETQKRLFNPFEQADNSMTRKYGGTGLGLAISQRLVKMMGGEIGTESAQGQGSTFWFLVRLNKVIEADDTLPANWGSPIVKHSVPSQSAEQLLKTRHSGTRILLVEDDLFAQEIAHGMLEHVGLVADLVDDGLQAIEQARQISYALILMDMQMPVMSGVEATRAIRADSLNQGTPILAMTANAFDEDRQVCLEAGMSDHITKPVNPQKLYETLLSWLEKPTAGSVA